jgi:hypothetical protein
MNDDLATAMTQLAEPAAPATLKATVMARIAREADREPRPAVREPAGTPHRRELPLWLLSFAGLAIVLGASAYGALQAGVPPDVTSPRSLGGQVWLPLQEPAALAVGLGLLVYVAGLLAPLRAGARR